MARLSPLKFIRSQMASDVTAQSPQQARKRWAETLFYPTLRMAMRRQFHSILLAGGDRMREATREGSAIAGSNHTNWWDGFVLSWVTRRATPECGFLLAMDEANLARYGFFRKLGVFGVDLRSGRTAALALRRLVPALQASREFCWIFPQGELLHPTRPIDARGGAGWLARKANIPLLPVALSYEWLIESRPSILIRAGEIVPATTPAKDFSELLMQLRWQIVQDAADLQLDDYTPILSPRLSLNKQWDRVRGLWRGQGGRVDRFNR